MAEADAEAAEAAAAVADAVAEFAAAIAEALLSCADCHVCHRGSQALVWLDQKPPIWLNWTTFRGPTWLAAPAFGTQVNGLNAP